MKINTAILLASVSAILFGLSNICYKLGITPLGEFTLGRVASFEFITQLAAQKWIVAGIILTIISGVFYIAALSHGEVVGVVAVLSLSYLVTALLANVFLDEPLTTFKIGGLGLIVVGIVIVNAGT